MQISDTVQMPPCAIAALARSRLTQCDGVTNDRETLPKGAGPKAASVELEAMNPGLLPMSGQIRLGCSPRLEAHLIAKRSRTAEPAMHRAGQCRRLALKPDPDVHCLQLAHWRYLFGRSNTGSGFERRSSLPCGDRQLQSIVGQPADSRWSSTLRPGRRPQKRRPFSRSHSHHRVHQAIQDLGTFDVSDQAQSVKDGAPIQEPAWNQRHQRIAPVRPPRR